MLPPPIERLRDAINSRDAARVANCFTENYQCDMPLHLSRSFTGDVVNWTHRNLRAQLSSLHFDASHFLLA